MLNSRNQCVDQLVETGYVLRPFTEYMNHLDEPFRVLEGDGNPLGMRTLRSRTRRLVLEAWDEQGQG